MRSLTSALVIGGAGFLGSWVVEELARSDVQIAVVDLPGQAVEDPVPGVEVIEGDLSEVDLGALMASREVDCVFHLAGSAFVPPSIEDPVADLSRNAVNTLEVLRQVQGREQPPLVVFVSSAAVYGNGHRMPMDEDHPLDPLSPYGVSKLAAERYVRVYSHIHGVPAISVRPFSLYGPRQRKLVVYDLFKRIHAGENPLVVSAPGQVSRDFVFAEDAARMIVALSQAGEGRGEVYNIAYGEPTTLEELVATMVEVAAVNAEVRFTGELRPGDPLRWFGDPARAAALGARCTTSLKEGLRRTNDWFLGTHDRREAG